MVAKIGDVSRSALNLRTADLGARLKLALSQHPYLRRPVTAALLALALAAPALAQSSAPGRIEIQAQPIDAFDNRNQDLHRFGMLEFRGGLQLTSPSRDFGGVSSIRIAPDGGRFIALTDKAHWLRGRIVYQGSKPTGIADAEMSPMLDANGNRLSARGWYDTEAIAEDGGTLYVGIERVNRIVTFDYGKNGLRARAVPVPLPEEFKGLTWNKGIEALVRVPNGLPLAGTLIGVTESRNAAGDIRAFLFGGPSPGEFSIKRTDDFDVGDAALLPGGDMLLLERRASWLRAAVRIRRLALTDVRAGVLVDAGVIFHADLGQQIDNLEGLAVHRTPAGDIVLTLVSDDNFSPL